GTRRAKVLHAGLTRGFGHREIKNMDGIGSPEVEPVRHSEGRLARALEDQTARLPSDTFLWAAGACIAAALALQLMDRRATSLFVGQWAPTLLVLGVVQQACENRGIGSRPLWVRTVDGRGHRVASLS